MAIVQATKTGTSKDTISAAWNKYNNTVTALLIEHDAAGTHGVLTATTVNALTLTAVATGFTIAGGTSSKTLTLDASLTASYLADITSAEADQIEAIGVTTISAAQWGYLGACGAGGGQLLAALTTGESDQLELIGATTISAAQWGYLGACGVGGGQLLAALTTGESTQLEAIGATTISAAQWGMLGAGVEWTAWVPTLTGGADLSGYDTARYYRIGDLCFFVFTANARNVTTAGIIQITLPFTSANTGAVFQPCADVYDGAAWIGKPHLRIDSNLNYISVYKTVNVGEWAGTETGVSIRISGFFEIA